MSEMNEIKICIFWILKFIWNLYKNQYYKSQFLGMPNCWLLRNHFMYDDASEGSQLFVTMAALPMGLSNQEF